MINAKENYLEWSAIVTELDDANKHLEELIGRMLKAGSIDEEEFRVDLGHIYAHLNRAWHQRRHIGEISSDQFSQFSRWPSDLEPIG